jgi:hypothetical protein
MSHQFMEVFGDRSREHRDAEMGASVAPASGKQVAKEAYAAVTATMRSASRNGLMLSTFRR